MPDDSSVIHIRPIAHIENDFVSKFGIPRQSGTLDTMRSLIVFAPEFRNRESLRGIDEYSHLWLIWQFSQADNSRFRPTVRPPRLGGNKRVGVFATRSPFRPNSLGLSSVRLIKVIDTADSGTALEVAGADLMNGTPIFDIKPYIKYSDCHPEASCSFSDEYKDYSLTVDLPKELSSGLSNEQRVILTKLLAEDPRPSYQHDPDREYTLDYANLSVSFKSDDKTLTVTSIKKIIK